MCGRYAMTSSPEAIRALFRYEDRPNFPARYNIAPTQPIAIVRIENGKRRFALVRWGLLPSWVKDPKAFALLINARGESVLDKPAFKNAMRYRRCLIPADGFYEWHPIDGAPLARGKPPKRPYWITREDAEPFAFAGLYSVWRAKDGDPWLLSCSILTEPALGSVERIHDRMPVILHPSRWEAWIERNLKDAAAAREMLLSDPSQLRLQPVSTLVNSPDNDGPELLREVDLLSQR